MNGPCKAVIVATFRCTAECRECCFECNPLIQERLSLNDIMEYIDEASEFENIHLVVWSGGECFLLGDDLLKGFQIFCLKPF